MKYSLPPNLWLDSSEILKYSGLSDCSVLCFLSSKGESYERLCSSYILKCCLTQLEFFGGRGIILNCMTFGSEPAFSLSCHLACRALELSLCINCIGSLPCDGVGRQASPAGK